MTDHAHRATISDAARASIQIAGLRQGVQLEITFRCEWDKAAQQIISAEPVFRGNERETRSINTQFRVGQMVLHTHPNGWVYPSSADLDSATYHAGNGVGYGICDPAGTELFLVTAPEDVGLYGFGSSPEKIAWYAAIKRRQLKLFGRTIDLALYPKHPCPSR